MRIGGNRMTHDVPLPFAARPQYPDRCVRCGRAHPETRASISVLVARPAQSSLLEDGVDLALGTSSRRASANQHVTLTPPACTRCVGRVRWHGIASLTVQYLGPLTGVAGLIYGLYAGHSYLGYAALALGICAPVIWWLWRPPALGVTAVGPNLVYEFRSAAIAEEFRRLNLAEGETESM